MTLGSTALLILLLSPASGCAAQAPSTAPDTPVSAPAQVAPARPAGKCQAPRFQKYVGRPVSSLPAKPRNAVWRVTCSTCAVTEDYNPSRLNIVYDDQTRIITRVWCG